MFLSELWQTVRNGYKSLIHLNIWEKNKLYFEITPRRARLPTLICLHGFCHNASLYMNETWIEELKTDFNIVLLNLPTLSMDVHHFVECVEKTWQQIGQPNLMYMLGHSLGGIIALMHQCKYNRAQAVICVASPLYGLWDIDSKELLMDLRAFVATQSNVYFLLADHDIIVRYFSMNNNTWTIPNTGHLSIMHDAQTHSTIANLLRK